MAVHAHYLAHAFPHDHRAIRPALDNAVSASVFLGEPGDSHPLAAAAVGGNRVLSDLTWNNSSRNNNENNACFLPRKRARAAGGDVAGAGLMIVATMQGQRAPVPVPVPVPAGDVQVQSRLLCSAAASTSATTASVVAPVSQGGLLSQLYRHGVVDIDALVRLENERLRAGLQEARRRHVRAVVLAAARRMRAAEDEVGRALARNAELDERVRQAEAEARAWQDMARCHEGVAAGLRATLDGLVQQSPSPCAAAAEDAQSCCFEQELEQEQGAEAEAEASGGRRARSRACRSCGDAEACVLLLPCRHLCLCRGCDAAGGVAASACPVCAATKNAALHVLLD